MGMKYYSDICNLPGIHPHYDCNPLILFGTIVKYMVAKLLSHVMNTRVQYECDFGRLYKRGSGISEGHVRKDTAHVVRTRTRIIISTRVYVQCRIHRIGFAVHDFVEFEGTHSHTQSDLTMLYFVFEVELLVNQQYRQIGIEAGDFILSPCGIYRRWTRGLSKYNMLGRKSSSSNSIILQEWFHLAIPAKTWVVIIEKYHNSRIYVILLWSLHAMESSEISSSP